MFEPFAQLTKEATNDQDFEKCFGVSSVFESVSRGIQLCRDFVEIARGG